MNNVKKKLGIVGGMGPLATAHFFELVVKLTDAEEDINGIHIFIDNNTDIPDRTKAILENGVSPVDEIVASINLLEKCGAEIIAIPCNTSHYYYDKIINGTNSQILNIIDITLDAAYDLYGNSCCGILATSGTIEADLYQRILKRKSRCYLLPTENEQEIIMQYIYDVVKANRKEGKIVKQLGEVLENMMKRGAQYFILGCTELSMIKNFFPFDKYYMIDSATELAKQAVLSCGYKIKEQGNNYFLF